MTNFKIAIFSINYMSCTFLNLFPVSMHRIYIFNKYVSNFSSYMQILTILLQTKCLSHSQRNEFIAL